jgi:hypothetical protein
MVHSIRAHTINDAAPRFAFGEDALRVLLAATVQSGTNQFPVRLRSVASTAALVESEVMPPAGSIVRLSRGSICVSARVTWAGAASFELAFRETVDERALLIQLGGSRPFPLPTVTASKALFPIEHHVGRSRGNVIPISKQ